MYISKKPITLGLLGASGRMGRKVVEVFQSEFSDRGEILASANRGDSFERLLDCDLVIDFSSPQAVLNLVGLTDKRTLPLPVFVIGSTGWSSSGEGFDPVLAQLASKTPVLLSSNFSIGIAYLEYLLSETAAILPKLRQSGFSPVLVETHHRHKKDSPSGTALTLRNRMKDGSIPIHSIRVGEVIGTHQVTFHGEGETLELIHTATDRLIFARGALETGFWLVERRNQGKITTGMVSMGQFFRDIREEANG